jgi:excisionase family DNA binding protein
MKTHPVNDESLLTIDELSDYLRVSPRTVFNLTKNYSLPRIKVGRSVRFQKSTVMDMLKKASRNLV